MYGNWLWRFDDGNNERLITSCTDQYERFLSNNTVLRKILEWVKRQRLSDGIFADRWIISNEDSTDFKYQLSNWIRLVGLYTFDSKYHQKKKLPRIKSRVSPIKGRPFWGWMLWKCICSRVYFFFRLNDMLLHSVGTSVHILQLVQKDLF